MDEFKAGPAREPIDLAELLKWKATGTIVTDDRRRRPLWFDGRFLDARALNAEQNYFLARQSDFGRVVGFGITTGLGVTAHPTRARTITIEAGHGLTPSGSVVMLPEALTVDLAAVHESQRLDAGFGISGLPTSPPFNRTGLYIVALRAVEYTANPISAYPTHVDAPRQVHDGSVIEATAVTLIPYPDSGARTELDARRQHVAREIFFEESRKGQPEDVLPLAMLALDHGILKWLDLFMVRREIGLRERSVWGLGVSPRPLRAAHLRQYATHLQELQVQLGSGARIIAAEHFSVLPPAGPMPVSGVSGADFTQSFFPAEMDVECSIVPEDELPALIEDSLLLPPLDLALSGEAHESTSVLIVMPVARHRFRTLSQRLPTLTRELPSAQPGMLARRKPITVLSQLLSVRLPTVPSPEESTADSLWRAELSDQSRLWYLRRRNLHYKAEVVSGHVEMTVEEAAVDRLVRERIAALNLEVPFNSVLSRATSGGAGALTAFLTSPLIREGSDTVARAAVAALEKLETVDTLAVMEVAQRFTGPAFGEGLARIESSDVIAGNSRVLENVAGSGLLPELDRYTHALPEREFRVFMHELAEAGSGSDAAAVERLSRLIEKRAATGRGLPRGPIVTPPPISRVPPSGGPIRG